MSIIPTLKCLVSFESAKARYWNNTKGSKIPFTKWRNIFPLAASATRSNAKSNPPSNFHLQPSSKNPLFFNGWWIINSPASLSQILVNFQFSCQFSARPPISPPRFRSKISRRRRIYRHKCILIEREKFDVVCTKRWVTRRRKFYEEELLDWRVVKVVLLVSRVMIFVGKLINGEMSTSRLAMWNTALIIVVW